MLHFSCDLCSCALDQQRYVVQLEAYPAFDPDELQAADLDADHLQAIAAELNDEASADELDDEATRQFRFDLCPACYRKFLRDPLGREAVRRLKFSKN
jgi:hypothetical protein